MSTYAEMQYYNKSRQHHILYKGKELSLSELEVHEDSEVTRTVIHKNIKLYKKFLAEKSDVNESRITLTDPQLFDCMQYGLKYKLYPKSKNDLPRKKSAKEIKEEKVDIDGILFDPHWLLLDRLMRPTSVSRARK